MILFFILVLTLVGRLWYLEILKGKDFLIASEKNWIREIYKSAPRGLIYDRFGKIILSNKSYYDLVIIPQYLKKSKETLEILSSLFNIPMDTIYKRLKEAENVPSFMPRRIKKNLTSHEVATIESMKFFLPGVDVDIVIRRNYRPNLSSNLFGYLGEVTEKEMEQLNIQLTPDSYHLGSVVGKLGIEKKFEPYLRGSEGKDFVQVDALGRLQSLKQQGRTYENIASVPGQDIYLTLDEDLQEEAIKAFKNKNGALVALNPQNGEILAYVSHPNFNLSLYQNGLSQDDWQAFIINPFKPLLDKVTGGVYPPGSTYKIITAIAALEEGLITPKQSYHCHGEFTLGPTRWRCWNKRGHGTMNLIKALEQSCDVYFYQLGMLLGSSRLAKWARLFGLGEKTALDLNMELPGLVPTAQWKLKNKGVPWSSGDTVNLSIGQGFNLTTPLQVVNMFAALANGGKLYRPYILHKIKDKNGNIIVNEVPKLLHSIPMKPENVQIVKKGLYDVVNAPTGTGKNSYLKQVPIAGKTGTAQNINLRKIKDTDELTTQQKDHAWFVGYSPDDKPEIAVVVLSEFDGGGGGSQAAPIVKQVIESYWRKRKPHLFQTPVSLLERETP